MPISLTEIPAVRSEAFVPTFHPPTNCSRHAQKDVTSYSIPDPTRNIYVYVVHVKLPIVPDQHGLKAEGEGFCWLREPWEFD